MRDFVMDKPTDSAVYMRRLFQIVAKHVQASARTRGNHVTAENTRWDQKDSSDEYQVGNMCNKYVHTRQKDSSDVYQVGNICNKYVHTRKKDSSDVYQASAKTLPFHVPAEFYTRRLQVEVQPMFRRKIHNGIMYWTIRQAMLCT
ncbi:hypothetical protein DPMN_071640, partial [Dreissena polymorpha]